MNLMMSKAIESTKLICKKISTKEISIPPMFLTWV